MILHVNPYNDLTELVFYGILKNTSLRSVKLALGGEDRKPRIISRLLTDLPAKYNKGWDPKKS